MRPAAPLALLLAVHGGACGGAGARPSIGPAPAAVATPDTGVRPTLERPAARGDGQPAPVLLAMKEELDRTFATLGNKADGPYFLAYQVTESRSLEVRSSFGAVITSAEDHARVLDVDARAGDHRRDNTHPLRDQGFGDFAFGGRPARLPLEDDPTAIKAAIWQKTSDELRAAEEQLVKVKAQQAVKVKEEDDSDDFSKETPVVFLEPPATHAIDRSAWEKRVNAWSALFRTHPEIHASEVSLQAEAETRYLVTSEGTLVQTARTHVRVFVTAETVADDGMELRRYETFDAPTAAGLPSDAEIRRRIQSVIDDLEALRKAPLAEPFVGPAILDGDAAAVFFHEVFGHRVEGHRQKDEEEGQTFARKVGEAIMPEFMDVFDDPTVRSLDGTPLNGYYRVDDEGVLARKASLVEAGVLKTFLLSRAPTRGFARSNGHGRRQEGFRVVSRQGNLIVSPRRTVSRDDLKRLLIDEVKRQGKPYGLRFRQVEGGFTMTARFAPQAFKVIPVIVSRVHPDGREELIRGADLEGTPLTALSKILAAADDWSIFNGVCGAESGWVPVAGASPSLLVAQVEIARKEKGQDKPPILPPPPVGGEK
jgi:TldD protein